MKPEIPKVAQERLSEWDSKGEIAFVMPTRNVRNGCTLVEPGGAANPTGGRAIQYDSEGNITGEHEDYLHPSRLVGPNTTLLAVTAAALKAAHESCRLLGAMTGAKNVVPNIPQSARIPKRGGRNAGMHMAPT